MSYNDEIGLTRTLASIETLIKGAAGEVECLVQDGGSTYAFDRIARMFPWASIISESDEGTYDAMNRGLERAKGEFVWMLNGGDEATSFEWRVLRDELLAAHGELLMYDYFRQYGAHAEYRLARKEKYLRHALPTSHQAILYPANESRAIGYSRRFLAADYEHTARHWMNGTPARVIHRPLAVFHSGGQSTTHVRQIARDASLIQREVLELPFVMRLLSRSRHEIASVRHRAKVRRSSGHDAH